MDAGYCTEKDLGSFVLAPDAVEQSKSQIVSMAIHVGNADQPPVNYPITRTGYYCVGTFGYSADEYKGTVVFRNAYGELQAAQIAKLPFYAAVTLVYAFLAMGWGALYWLNRRDILAVQNYITAILAFLVLEMFFTWLFYDYQNRHGLSVGAQVLLVLVSVLSAARNSFSFFLLLIVCMGYGVVKPSLGKTMVYVRYLAIAHFAFGVIYAVASLSVTPENAGPLVLLVVLPLAGTLTAFYIWTLSSLGATMKDLRERKQTVKAAMYRRLWWCILLSIAVIFVFFLINSWNFAGVSNEDFVPTHWQARWFILDGWVNVVFFVDVAFIAYVWRPSANNRRFAMSDEASRHALTSHMRMIILTDECRLPKTTMASISPRANRLTLKRKTRIRRRTARAPTVEVSRLNTKVSLRVDRCGRIGMSHHYRHQCRPSRRRYQGRVWKERPCSQSRMRIG